MKGTIIKTAKEIGLTSKSSAGALRCVVPQTKVSFTVLGESWTERWQELDRQAYKLAAEQLQADYHQKQRANATAVMRLGNGRAFGRDRVFVLQASPRQRAHRTTRRAFWASNTKTDGHWGYFCRPSRHRACAKRTCVCLSVCLTVACMYVSIYV